MWVAVVLSNVSFILLNVLLPYYREIEQLANYRSDFLLGQITAIEDSPGTQCGSIVAICLHPEALGTFATTLRVFPLPLLRIPAVWANNLHTPIREWNRTIFVAGLHSDYPGLSMMAFLGLDIVDSGVIGGSEYLQGIYKTTWGFDRGDDMVGGKS
jgi:hypothetical protein